MHKTSDDSQKYPLVSQPELESSSWAVSAERLKDNCDPLDAQNRKGTLRGSRKPLGTRRSNRISLAKKDRVSSVTSSDDVGMKTAASSVSGHDALESAAEEDKGIVPAKTGTRKSVRKPKKREVFSPTRETRKSGSNAKVSNPSKVSFPEVEKQSSGIQSASAAATAGVEEAKEKISTDKKRPSLVVKIQLAKLPVPPKVVEDYWIARLGTKKVQ